MYAWYVKWTIINYKKKKKRNKTKQKQTLTKPVSFIPLEQIFYYHRDWEVRIPVIGNTRGLFQNTKKTKNISIFRPAQFLADEVVQLLIMIVEEFTQLRHDRWIYSRVLSTFALVQTPFTAVRLQAIEPLRLVEVEIISGDFRVQTQERFDFLHLGHWVLDQPVSVHYQYLVSRKHFQPLQHERVVHWYRYWPVVRTKIEDQCWSTNVLCILITLDL